MAGTLQHKRGTTLQHIIDDGLTFGYTGPEGELTVDTTMWTVRVHDGFMTGGYPLARADLSNVTNNFSTSILVGQTGHGITSGEAVYYNLSLQIWEKAKADDVTTLGVAVAQYLDDDSFRAVFAGQVDGLTGLPTGEYMFVSAVTAGELTPIEPSYPNMSNPIFYNVSSSSGIILPWRPSLISTSNFTTANSVTASNYTVVESDQVILANAYLGNMNIYLPDLSSNININRDLHIKKVDSTGYKVTINATGSQTIDGAASQVISYQYNSMHIVGSNNGWNII